MVIHRGQAKTENTRALAHRGNKDNLVWKGKWAWLKSTQRPEGNKTQVKVTNYLPLSAVCVFIMHAWVWFYFVRCIII